jgi:hypothetical protein
MKRERISPAEAQGSRDVAALLTRRQFFGVSANGIGRAALASMLGGSFLEHAARASAAGARYPGLGTLPHFAPKAKRVIYLFMVGAPSQIDLFDHKPVLKAHFDKDLPDSIRQGQRLTTMTSGQTRFPVAPSIYDFRQYGESGAWVSELLPWTARMVDDIAIVKTVHTEAINHEPAVTLMNTGNQIAGKACLGSWVSYGLGSLNADLPTFVVLHAKHSNPQSNVQAISARLWGAGFLPAEHSGVALRSGADPVLFLPDPPGVSRDMRRAMLDGLQALNRETLAAVGDPEIQARIAQYEMAFRMQASVPELTDLSGESDAILDQYGPDSRKPGTFAHCAMLARRLVERGVRFVQIYHRGWDQHNNLPRDLPQQCRDVDQPCFALIQDLKARGMLEDTLVIWGGEFGRTVYCQGPLTDKNYGRDHHPRCFSLWMAGGGVRPGIVYGETDDFSYNITRDPVHIRDLHATVLSLLGIDHARLSFKFQGLDQKLTGVEPAHLVPGILA